MKAVNMPGNTLHALVLTITPVEEVEIRATMGHQVHAAFLKTIQQVDAALAEVLHMPELTQRPFTVSPLQGTPPAHRGRIRLRPGENYWLRFTILYPPIFERFMARFLQGKTRPTLRLGAAQLLIREILATPEGHPWAGYTDWQRLASVEPNPEVVLEFTTPTAFSFGRQSWGQKIQVLPQPETVFGSLVRTWNNMAPLPLQLDRQALRTYLGEHAVVKRMAGIRTRMLRYRHAPQVGFVGCVTYGLMADNEIARVQLNALAGLAFYSGVGMKTTMGMGQCRRVDN
jgi:CRISPR-associated endoribonuclease Cas6